MLDFFEIKKCRICDSRHFTTIIDLGFQSLSGIFPRANEKDPMQCPLELVKCDQCDLVQLKHSVNPSLMFTDCYGYRSGINQTMQSHLKGIVTAILRILPLEDGDVVLDIGCNDGTLLNFYSHGLKKIGIDPVAHKFKDFYDNDTTVVADFFSKEVIQKSLKNFDKAKIITSISMFYDLEDPVDFAQNIAACLDQEGVWVFEQSYLPLMLEKNSFDTICHEHLEYYALKQIEYILKKASLKVIDIDFNEINGGSIRIYAAHMDSKHTVNLEKLSAVRLQEEQLNLSGLEVYQKFKETVQANGKKLVDFLKKETEQGKVIHVYGASTKGNIILQYCQIDSRLIEFAADRNPEKFGCRTPGSNIKIISEEESRAKKPDYFLVLPWHFKNEFIKRESSYGVKFIFPLPELNVVE